MNPGNYQRAEILYQLSLSRHLKYKNDPHRAPGSLLGDGVGLGKTLWEPWRNSSARSTPYPSLIDCPKPLLEQWQEELLRKLNDTSCAGTETAGSRRGRVPSPALPHKATNCPHKVGIVSTSVITVAPRSLRNQALVDQFAARTFACVIWDEAHKILGARCPPRMFTVHLRSGCSTRSLSDWQGKREPCYSLPLRRCSCIPWSCGTCCTFSP